MEVYTRIILICIMHKLSFYMSSLQSLQAVTYLEHSTYISPAKLLVHISYISDLLSCAYYSAAFQAHALYP